MQLKLLFLNKLQKKHWIVIAIWFTINIIQSIFTELHFDESYYWVYSRNMAWGFFDHPPMTALLIKIGYSIFQNELGVRLLFIIMGTLSIAMVMNELDDKKDFIFLIVFIFSFPLAYSHMGGFLAIPDIPLVFFTILFFLIYKNFLKSPGIANSIILSLVISALIYSKYHSFLIILFTLLANLKLFKNKYFWLVVLLTIVFVSPHILWQFENDFPSFKYHLVERSNTIGLKYTISYLFGQLIIAGPLTGLIAFRYLKIKNIKSLFQKTLIFNILGFYTIFFILSFYNRIEGHWTAAIMPLLMIIVYPEILNKKRVKNWYIKLSLPFIILVFFVRIFVGTNAIPNFGGIKSFFYKREELAKEIQELASNKKVGFYNDYGSVSNYIFYTGEDAILLSTPDYRFCQFDLWDDELLFEGDSIYALYPEGLFQEPAKTFCSGNKYGIKIINGFLSLKKLELNIIQAIYKNDNIEIHFTITNKSGTDIYFEPYSNPEIGWLQEKSKINSIPLKNLIFNNGIMNNESIPFSIVIPRNTINLNKNIHFFTKTSYNNRGEIINLNPDDIIN